MSKTLFTKTSHKITKLIESYDAPDGVKPEDNIFVEMKTAGNITSPSVTFSNGIIYVGWQQKDLGTVVDEYKIKASGSASLNNLSFNFAGFSVPTPQTLTQKVMAYGIFPVVFFIIALANGWGWATWVDENVRARVIAEKLITGYQKTDFEGKQAILQNSHALYRSPQAKSYKKERGQKLSDIFNFMGQVKMAGGNYDLFMEKKLAPEMTHGQAQNRCERYPLDSRLPKAVELEKINLLDKIKVKSPVIEWTNEKQNWSMGTYRLFTKEKIIQEFREDLQNLKKLDLSEKDEMAKLLILAETHEVETVGVTNEEVRVGVFRSIYQNFLEIYPESTDLKDGKMWVSGSARVPSRCVMLVATTFEEAE